MSSSTTAFSPDVYRGFLLVLARQGWNDALRACCEPSDVVQQTLLEAVENLGQFRGKTVAQFRAWLRTMLTRNIIDTARARLRQKWDYRLEQPIEASIARSSDAACNFARNDPSPSDDVAKEEDLLRMMDALARLPDDQFTAVTLHHLEGLPLRETAARMGRSKDAVAGLISRGKARVRELMMGGGGGP